MLRINRENREFSHLKRKSMREAGYWERRDIQEMICRTPDEFCEELGEYIHFVGSELYPSDVVMDRIDLLGIDEDGVSVIVEIKRDSHKLQLLQALSYAGMVSKWEAKRFLEELCKFNNSQQTIEQVKEELEDILEEGDVEAINRNQRIVLLAEEFDYEVLITAEWLWERYELDIRCYRLVLASDENSDFLTCTRTYPPLELTDIATRRRRKREIGSAGASDWNELLQNWIENSSEVEFIKRELASGQESRPVPHKTLIYRANNKRLYTVYVKKQFATVEQLGRFEGDEEYWAKRLGSNANIRTRRYGRALRFRLSSEDDFKAFKNSWKDGAAIKSLTDAEFDSEVISDEPESER